MANVRKIQSRPEGGKNYYLVDANFLANKHIPESKAPAGKQRQRIQACKAWWDEIDDQVNAGVARVYVPDICIAEAFKVLAKKYFEDKWFKYPVELKNARDALAKDIHTPPKALKAFIRKVRYHDISTNRDIIIGIDRFFEIFMKHKKKVSVPDLITVATAKYVMEFYDVPKDRLHIVTLDYPLREGVAKVAELPSAYDPTLKTHAPSVVFLKE
jgi:predicted nucleic acid-binding protein